VQRFTREHPDLDFVARSGNRATEDFTLARWLVAMDMEPDLPGLVGGVMAVKDYVRQRLCQAADMVTEANEASDTQLFDVVAEEWDEEIVEAAGVPRHALPGLVSPESVVGQVEARGLAVPCIAGVGDQVAAAWGVGAWEPGTASVSLGTSGVVLLRTMAADVPEHCGELGLKVHNTGVPGEREVSGSIPALGLALEWAAGMVGGRSPGAGRPAGRDLAGGPRFFPYSPLGVQGSVNEVPPGFLAAEREVGREEVAAIVVSGLAFELATILQELALAGLRVERVVCSGGGARSAALLQLLASCVPVPVYRTTLPSASAVGVALLAARAVGAEAVARPRLKPVPTGDRPRALTDWQEERRRQRGQQAAQGRRGP
jgi:xylulokinase